MVESFLKRTLPEPVFGALLSESCVKKGIPEERHTADAVFLQLCAAPDFFSEKVKPMKADLGSFAK